GGAGERLPRPHLQRPRPLREGRLPVRLTAPRAATQGAGTPASPARARTQPSEEALMSDPIDRRDEETPEEPGALPEADELEGEDLEEVSGGVIDGGCIPPLPWEKPAPWEQTFLPG